MDPRYMNNLEKNTFKPCTPTMKKNCEKRGAFLTYWRLISLLSFEKELGWEERLVQQKSLVIVTPTIRIGGTIQISLGKPQPPQFQQPA